MLDSLKQRINDAIGLYNKDGALIKINDRCIANVCVCFFYGSCVWLFVELWLWVHSTRIQN